MSRLTGKGGYNALCQVCHFQYKAVDLRKRWDGLWVCKYDWETRHPQEFIKAVPDNLPLPFTSPDEVPEQCLKLGTAGSINLASPVPTNLLINSFTVAAWVMPTDDTLIRTGRMGVFDFWHPFQTNQSWRLEIGGGKNLDVPRSLSFVIFIGSQVVLAQTVANVITPFAWNHVAVTRSIDGRTKLYVNGELAPQDEHRIVGPFTISGAQTNSLHIGEGFIGYISEARTYGYEVSQLNLQRDMKELIIDTHPGSLLFPLHDGHNNVVDLSDGAITATVVGPNNDWLPGGL